MTPLFQMISSTLFKNYKVLQCFYIEMLKRVFSADNIDSGKWVKLVFYVDILIFFTLSSNYLATEKIPACHVWWNPAYRSPARFCKKS